MVRTVTLSAAVLDAELTVRGRHDPAIIRRICPVLDSVTALLTNEMFRDGEFDPHAAERVAEELCELADSVGSIVFVSDFIFADTGMYDEFTETYRAGLARCDAALARCCDTVVEINLATPILYKGVMPL